MFRFSSRSRYAVRALVDIAEQTEKRRAPGAPGGAPPVRLSDVASRQNIPQVFLGQIFGALRRAGLVKSVRGYKGGYLLAKPAARLPVWDVVSAIEGRILPAFCLMSEFQSPECRKEGPCRSKTLCSRLDGRIKQALMATTIEDLSGQPAEAS